MYDLYERLFICLHSIGSTLNLLQVAELAIIIRNARHPLLNFTHAAMENAPASIGCIGAFVQRIKTKAEDQQHQEITMFARLSSAFLYITVLFYISAVFAAPGPIAVGPAFQ